MRLSPTRVWFGPTAVGKSTFLRRVGGIELVNWPDWLQRALRDKDDPWFLPAMDVLSTAAHVTSNTHSVELFNPALFTTVLVLPRRPIYDARRAARAAAGRDGVDDYDVYAAMKTRFEHVIDDFPLDAEATL